MLRIFRPEDEIAPPVPVDSPAIRASIADQPEDGYQPVLLNFQEWSDRLRGHSQSQLHRARQIHANCECPECHAALIVPLVLNDGRREPSGEEVPGTATLVGFHCDICSAEWPA
ncbi:MAG: hypothetical protein VB858_00160 [Planctomycetaceae bacterium]